MKAFACDVCEKAFHRKADLTRHKQIHERIPVSLPCDECEATFMNKGDLLMHKKSHKILKSYKCEQCDQSFGRKSDLLSHIRTNHPLKRKSTSPHTSQPKKVKKSNAALGVFTVHTINSSEEACKDLIMFFDEVRPTLNLKLEEEVEEKHAIKWYGVLNVIMKRTTREGDVEIVSPYFRSTNVIELMPHTIRHHIEEGFGKIYRSFEEFTQHGSGWSLEKINNIKLHIAKYQPLAASSYIPLPKKLADKKAILNVQNNDKKCLVWCLLAHQMQIHWKDHPHRVSHYVEFESTIQLGDIVCPVPLTMIPKVEQLNNLRINVFGFEEEVFPLYVSPREDEDVINLLLLSSEERQHYCLIRNFSRLLGDLTKHNEVSYYCYPCLQRFCREDLLRDHMPYCNEHPPTY